MVVKEANLSSANMKAHDLIDRELEAQLIANTAMVEVSFAVRLHD